MNRLFDETTLNPELVKHFFACQLENVEQM
jgi:hypothetical protein